MCLEHSERGEYKNGNESDEESNTDFPAAFAWDIYVFRIYDLSYCEAVFHEFFQLGFGFNAQAGIYRFPELCHGVI